MIRDFLALTNSQPATWQIAIWLYAGFTGLLVLVTTVVLFDGGRS